MSRRRRRTARPRSTFYQSVIVDDRDFASVRRVARIELLEPRTRAAVEDILRDSEALGIELMVFETYRSRERQQALFIQGASSLREVGLHHYGLACDLVRNVAGEPSWKGDWRFLGDLARHHSLVWGGDWGRRGVAPQFYDGVHVQRVTVARQAAIFRGEWYPGAQYDPYEDGAT